ncbi:O-antigen ligase family protein [Planomicrobium okeanokoites]|uniref:O-antigen ligase family protein n=1 Tax=Planomicrobium okeanokoites TaxID=244 RepID=A0ABV7KN84_PLAOK|nr:O-antigen ligase family protein [Planomicrobium okeanokoites]TAA66056.1 hypothetical protein D2910_15520 [Planomicrobium okeanokoites]
MLILISAVLLMFAVSSLAVTKEKTFLICLFVMTWIPYYRIFSTPSLTHYYQTGIILLLFFVLVLKYLPRFLADDMVVRTGPLAKEMLFLLLFAVFFFGIGTIRGNSITNSLGQLFIFAEIVIFYFITYNLLYGIDLQKFIRKFVGVLMFSVCAGAVLVAIGIFPPTTVFTPMEHFRIVLSAPLFSWFIAAYLIQELAFTNKRNFHLLIYLLPFLLFVYLSHFRSYWLGFVSTVFMIYLLNFLATKGITISTKRILLNIGLAAGAVALYFYTLVYDVEFLDYGFERIYLAASFQDPSVLTRMEEMKELGKLVKENALFGSGLGAEYMSFSHSAGHMVSKNYIHNIVYFFLFKSGFVGFGIILAVVASIFYKLFLKQIRKADFTKEQINLAIVLFSFIIGLSIASLSEPEIINFLYTPFIGILLSLLSLNTKKE